MRIERHVGTHDGILRHLVAALRCREPASKCVAVTRRYGQDANCTTIHNNLIWFSQTVSTVLIKSKCVEVWRITVKHNINSSCSYIRATTPILLIDFPTIQYAPERPWCMNRNSPFRTAESLTAYLPHCCRQCNIGCCATTKCPIFN